MKKINSIWYGAIILKWGLVFTLIFPLLIYLVSWIFGLEESLFFLIKISVVIGLALLVFLCILLMIELKQDKKINLFYEKNRNTKIKIENGYYECRNCGNRKLRESDRSCSVCGVKIRK